MQPLERPEKTVRIPHVKAGAVIPDVKYRCIALLFLALTNRSATFFLVTLVSIPLCIIPIRIVARRLIKKVVQQQCNIPAPLPQ